MCLHMCDAFAVFDRGGLGHVHSSSLRTDSTIMDRISFGSQNLAHDICMQAQGSLLLFRKETERERERERNTREGLL